MFCLCCVEVARARERADGRRGARGAGLNEDSWAVFSIDKGAKKGRKAAKHATGQQSLIPALRAITD
eukprot:1811198-Rhodomonas_salina.2